MRVNIWIRRWRSFTDPWNFERPKDGENIQDILTRTKDFWEELIHDPALQDKTILIASHGCAVRALLHNVYNDPKDFWHGLFLQTAVSM